MYVCISVGYNGAILLMILIQNTKEWAAVLKKMGKIGVINLLFTDKTGMC
jgi:hypothetical protein